ncbi:MAG: CHASE2 domain-containing protein, partial [Acidobacteriota bacterium]|nr:CHASE2 domain-containing protein [Acidobacteriota bacterium]
MKTKYFVLAGLPVASLFMAVVLDDLALGQRFDQYAYDFFYRLESPKSWTPESIILAIDEATLGRYGGQFGIRDALADGLMKIAPAHPAVVAVDVILADRGAPETDTRLEQAFASTHNLILASYVRRDRTWENPLPRFRAHAAAVGQVHADFDKYDAVSRDLPLAKAAGIERRWALGFEAFLAAKGRRVSQESPDEINLGSLVIPTGSGEEHAIRILYAPPEEGGIPRISIAELDRDPSLAKRFAGKAVFVGETVQARDSWMTPYSNSNSTPGIEMNASLYETLAQHFFLTDASATVVWLVALGLAGIAAASYAFGSAWTSNAAGAVVILISQASPAVAFQRQVVWPWLPATLMAIFTVALAATWRHFAVTKELARAERQKDRYQRAMQFVTHEMRTPLTAIQGSSELIGRYASMPEAKRKQMADLINSESKRLARMIETFLSVERLSAGQMELKQERVALPELVERCADRARPLAERKQIDVDTRAVPAGDISGDRELLEYAVYNLLTNAVKYSPAQTRVRVFGEDEKGGRVRLCVEDQGIGMDKKEVGRIFEKFYRTRRAEQSGEAGTGIGLSIV